jgi:uncharacterized membrane protein
MIGAINDRRDARMDAKGTLAGRGHWAHFARRLRRHPRFNTCAVLFVALAVALSVAGMPVARAVLLAFDIAVLLFLGAAVHMFAHSTRASICHRARLEDESYWGFLLGSAAVAVIALVALALELHSHKGGVEEIVLAAISLLLAWLFLNTIFALHYAHEFYGEAGQKHHGLEFPGTREPDYWDFIYFAFVIGMTFQVSDVQISEWEIRHVALAHAIIAFFFNVIVIALSVNVVAGGL